MIPPRSILVPLTSCVPDDVAVYRHRKDPRSSVFKLVNLGCVADSTAVGCYTCLLCGTDVEHQDLRGHLDKEHLQPYPLETSAQMTYWIACLEGDLAKVQEGLMDLDVDPNWYNPLKGMGPLHAAIYQGHIDVVSELLSRPEISLSQRDAFNRDPLLLAVQLGQLDISFLLVDAKQKRSCV